ncbi:DoxX family protein [Pseudanabaena sp. UWO310]|uniref:DoxX family protein n=1 Tax=Pseudanabaena sp. UWO310 TaxID=2480795 RepID=UPI001157ECFF|nr:DoxX family protein [Pseudanabaena sp. UWO310]TYQ30253.1 DoxX family membrane protein [Pseudanabaena sp. UWO310]
MLVIKFVIKSVKPVKLFLRVVLSLFLIAAGTLHWLMPNPFVKIVPSFLPYPLALVYISGVFEILGGIGLLLPSVSIAAAWGAIALFVAVFPANINMAVNRISLDGIPDSDFLRWGRLPLQAVLIAWAWWYTREDS